MIWWLRALKLYLRSWDGPRTLPEPWLDEQGHQGSSPSIMSPKHLEQKSEFSWIGDRGQYKQMHLSHRDIPSQLPGPWSCALGKLWSSSHGVTLLSRVAPPTKLSDIPKLYPGAHFPPQCPVPSVLLFSPQDPFIFSTTLPQEEYRNI